MVAKGGNFLLNIAPSPKGEFDADAYDRLREIGAWMSINGEAIYNTRPIAPYKDGKISFTSLKNGTVFAIYLADENETGPPAKIVIPGIRPGCRFDYYDARCRHPVKMAANHKRDRGRHSCRCSIKDRWQIRLDVSDLRC